jgi:redox-sensitive bicupin YhaK (pirin superfamily)
MGNDFQYNEGDFIQFTSGKGALHMEETGDELFENGGVFHGIQSWLNIPTKLKKSEPNATHVKKSEIAILEKEHATIRVILGEVFGVKAKTQLLMPVIYWHITLKENVTLELPVDRTQNAFVYLIEGSLEVNGAQTVSNNQAVLYERNGDSISIKAQRTSDFLVLGGEVNNETYVASGPFVVNTQEELYQAYSDFENGKFGDLTATNGVRRQ